ncbi:MAG: hypothetical protein P4L92_23015 [Rudaea sp.]|nr:hypothetical protein [Rudaea sp.]
MGQMTMLYGLRPPATMTSGTAVPSYLATNAGTPGNVLKPWKGTTLGADYLQIDLGATAAISGLALNAGNMSSVTVFADNSNPPTTNRGTLTLSQDGQGRWKGSMAVVMAVRYIRFTIAAGTPNDGATGWSIANALVFASTFSPPRDPLFSGSSIDSNTPQSRADLDNGVVICDNTGAPFETITLSFSGGAGDGHEQIQRYARAGVCWLNLGVATAPWYQWPVFHYDPKVTRKLSGFNRELVDITLKEVA